MSMSQKVTPFLWYDSDAPGVARYYQSIFGVENVVINSDAAFDSELTGGVQIVTIMLYGVQFQLMSAGRHNDFNDSISFVVDCDDQLEIDRIWDAITADGGQESQCGWCIDKHGVRWQIVPHNLDKLLWTPAATQKMLTMKKLIIAELEAVK